VNLKAVTLYNKALELIKKDKLTQAKRNLEKATKLVPDFFQAHTSLGNIYEKEGYFKRALDCYQKANKLLPNSPIILTNIGNAFKRLNDDAESVKFYNAALNADPTFTNALLNLLSVQIKSNHIEDAYNLVQSKNGDVSLHLVLGGIFLQLVNDKSSSQYLDIKSECLAIAETFGPNEKIKKGIIKILTDAQLEYCPFQFFLAYLTQQFENHYAIFADFLLDILLKIPSCTIVYYHLSSLQHIRSGQFDTALSNINKCIELGCPDSFKSPLIDSLFGLNRTNEALKNLHALKDFISPTPVTASLFFREHDFITAWSHYSKTQGIYNHITKSDPDIFDIQGKSILLLSNQGIGDVVMFLSCLNDFLARYEPKAVTINCEKRLHGIIQSSFPKVTTIWDPNLFDPRLIDETYETIKSHQTCIKLPSICSLTRTDITSFYPQRPYLLADKKKSAEFENKIASLENSKSIGFAWKGGIVKNTINNKNINLADFIPLFKIPGINWINLQYGDVADEISSFNDTHGTNLIHFDEINPLNEINSQFALIANLDLVIQTSNTSIHFAGSQGIPTWVMITEPSDFRWFDGKDKDIAPWYENMRVCRKKHSNKWSSYIASLANELQIQLESNHF